MFEFNKVMKDYESLNAIERGLMLTEKSVSILAKLSVLDIDGLREVTVEKDINGVDRIVSGIKE